MKRHFTVLGLNSNSAEEEEWMVGVGERLRWAQYDS